MPRHKTPTLLAALVFSALLVAVGTLRVRDGVSGRSVFKGPNGVEAIGPNALPPGGAWVTPEQHAALPEAQQAVFGTFRHDPSVVWDEVLWGASMLVFSLLVGARCVSELRQRPA